jgi:hypothetical protein
LPIGNRQKNVSVKILENPQVMADMSSRKREDIQQAKTPEVFLDVTRASRPKRQPTKAKPERTLCKRAKKVHGYQAVY